MLTRKKLIGDQLGDLFCKDCVGVIVEYAVPPTSQIFREKGYSKENCLELVLELLTEFPRMQVTMMAGYSGTNIDRNLYTMLTTGGYRGPRGIWQRLIDDKVYFEFKSGSDAVQQI